VFIVYLESRHLAIGLSEIEKRKAKTEKREGKIENRKMLPPAYFASMRP
jgi:hypothetical protein